mgnify:CR=1 FL=1
MKQCLYRGECTLQATSETTELSAPCVARVGAVAQCLQAAIDPTAASQRAAIVMCGKEEFVCAAIGGRSPPRSRMQRKWLAQAVLLKIAFPGLGEDCARRPEHAPRTRGQKVGTRRAQPQCMSNHLRGGSVGDHSGVDRRTRGVMTNS